MPSLQVSVEPPTELTGKQLVEEVFDSAIKEYEAWFSDPQRGNGRLASFEKEVLRSFCWFMVVERGKADG